MKAQGGQSVELRYGGGNSKLLSAILRLPEFRHQLQGAAREILSQSPKDATEGTIEGAFERVLYAVLRDFGIKFHPSKQVAPDSRRHVGSGRVDSRIAGVIIEYKSPAKLSSNGAIEVATHQLKEYMESFAKENGGECYGFLSDGRRYRDIRCTGGVAGEPAPLKPLSGEALLSLVQSIVSLDLTALTPSNLIKDFCADTETGTLFKAARTFFSILGATNLPKTQMLRSEWESLFRLGHNDKSQQKPIEVRRAVLSEIFGERIKDPSTEYRAIFSLHTVYAIIVKLMAYRVLSELRFGKVLTAYHSLLRANSSSLRAGLARLEDGEIFRDIGILNLLEGDFFSWYSDRQQWTDDIADVLRTILGVLSRYEQTSAVFPTSRAMDLFRELYEAAVPQAVRASFGEFYTPYWLARHVLESVATPQPWRVLDPCCGSGTFVITAIEKVKQQGAELSRKDLLCVVLKRVAAIDLNPLAALTSRVNYFLHIADLLPDTIQDLVIPVYLGDASYVPTKVELGGVPCFEYHLRTLKRPIHVVLPIVLVEDTARFVKLMHRYESAVKSKRIDRAIEVILDAIPQEARSPEVTEHVERLSASLVALEGEGWNGVWARIVTNFLTTAAIGKFDIVIGNPPWVDWKNLPEGYRNKIKSLCIDRGLFSGEGRTGGINLNVCALIAHVVTENWLSPKGHLAFLMPRELTVQPSYEGWRRFPSLTRRYFKCFYDWSDSGHPFAGRKGGPKEDFLTFVIGPEPAKGGVVPVTRYAKRYGDRSSASEWHDLGEAMSHLTEQNLYAGQVVKESTAFTYAGSRAELRKFEAITGDCAYIGREGIEFYPQELLLFKYVEEGPTRHTVFVRNIQVTKSKYRVEERTLLLETKYLFPLVKGRSIHQFRHDYEGIVVPFPYIADTPHKPVPADRLEDESPYLLRYYLDHKEIIEAQTDFSNKIRGLDAGEFYGLARTGHYSFREVYVAFRDNTKWAASVIKCGTLPWGGRRRFVFQNHAVSMCERAEGGFITSEEAHYVCAILNAPIVERFIMRSSDLRSFKIRPPVYLPRFDCDEERHQRLAQLSEEAHENPRKVEGILGEVESLYLELCSER